MITDLIPYAKSNIYEESFFEGLLPDEMLLVSEWADKYRVLSQVSSAEAGSWRTSRTPYLKEIMDSLSTGNPIEEIVFMKSAQIGGTECGNNFIGYVIDHAPGPLMMVMPRTEDARKNSKIRIQPLIDNSPRLKSKVKDARSRDSGNTLLQKDFPGGTLILVGANSAAGLRSVPVRYLIFDEEDAYPGDVQGEGDPIELGKKRTNTFSSRKKIFHISTPTVEGRSRISANYDLTDQRKYFVPCPICNEFQHLKFANLKWDKKRPEDIYYECEHCEGRIKNWQKTKMLANGKWIATAEASKPKIIGFHINALYCPVGWLSWEDIARSWDEAQIELKLRRNTEKLKTFVNTILGETWKDKGEAPKWRKIYDRREEYRFNSIPDGVCFLTAGVDVQKDRLEMEVVGWGRNRESWSIDYRIFLGDTSSLDSPCWKELTGMLGEYWTTSGELDLNIKSLAIDSGYNTQTVYNWVRQFSPRRVVAIKGMESQSTIASFPKDVDVKITGRKSKVRKAAKLYTLGVSVLKQELYGWLKQEKPLDGEAFGDGYCHFPQYSEEHFKRLTAEELQVKHIRGFRKYEWVKTQSRNEQLDCRIYARAAAYLCGMDRIKSSQWDTLEAQAGIKIERQPEKNVQELKKKRKKVKIKRRKSRFME